MATEPLLHLHLRRQVLDKDAGGHNCWRVDVEERSVRAAQTAVLVCDMWDKHWSRGAQERVAAMAPRMNRVLAVARDRGILIIHCPSDTMPVYAGTPARERALNAPAVQPPDPLAHADPKLPIDDSDEGSDTGEPSWYPAWTRQHPAIEIDQRLDAISDDGGEVYNLIHRRDIAQLVMMGVHANMCILNRSFGVKQMVRWGLSIALVRDLTDAMYNPAMSPYVSHDEGTHLVVEYIEKFWCPTIASVDLTTAS